MAAHDQPGGDGVALELSDGRGMPVATVRELVSRPVSAVQLAGGADESLFGLERVPLPGGAPTPVRTAVWGAADLGLGVSAHAGLGELAALAPVPDVIVLPATPASGADSPPTEARTELHRVLDAVRSHLADERLARTRLAVLVRDDDLTHAPLGGLLGAAESENPGRFLLVHADAHSLESTEPADAVRLLATAPGSHEPEVFVGEGEIRVPRLARAKTGEGPRWDTAGTVLVTGGVIARHPVNPTPRQEAAADEPSRRTGSRRGAVARRTHRPGKRRQPFRGAGPRRRTDRHGARVRRPDDARFIALGRRKGPETAAFATGVARLYADGLAPNWAAL